MLKRCCCQDANTGHDGSLSTGHGNSPEDMLTRLETMFLMGMEIPLQAIRRQIASGIDLIVHLGRLRDKSRKVLQIMELLGVNGVSGEIITRTLYEFREEGGNCEEVKGSLIKINELQNVRKLQRAGIRTDV